MAVPLAQRHDSPEDPGTRRGVRIDRWLWATRIAKTRAEAAEDCRAGRVAVNGSPVKPSRLVQAGDRIEVTRGPLVRTLEVVGLVEKRVGASRVRGFLLDVTPPEALDKAREAREQERLNDVFAGLPGRPGRPTKKDRRQWETFLKAVDKGPDPFGDGPA